MPLIERQGPRFVPGRAAYFTAVCFLAIGGFEAYSYLAMGSSPRELDAARGASLFNSRSSKQWVRLSGLSIDCSTEVRELRDGKVSRRFYMGTDVGGRERFVVHLVQACVPDSSQVYEGVLEETTVEFILTQLSAAGLAVKSGDRIPYFRVGETSSDTMSAALLFSALGLSAGFAIWWGRKREAELRKLGL